MRRLTRRSLVSFDAPDEIPNKPRTFNTKFSLPSFTKRVEKLTADQRKAIENTGFGNLLLIPNHTLSKILLLELMDRWTCDKHAFTLLENSTLTITSMDVALILGLRASGTRVTLREDELLSDLEIEYGVVMPNRNITIVSLESRLDSIADAVNEDFVRTFLLFAFGTILFPSTTGKVDSRYLHLLQDLDSVHSFAWGVAVLEELYLWLDRRKEKNVLSVGGCLIFLQIWFYEHIDIARPDLSDSLTFPRACRWKIGRAPHKQLITDKFKELQDHQITWELQPTSTELQSDFIKELLVLGLPSNSDSVAELDNISSEPTIGSASPEVDSGETEASFETQHTEKEIPDQHDTSVGCSNLDVVELESEFCQPTIRLSSSNDGECVINEESIEQQTENETLAQNGTTDSLQSRIQILEERKRELEKENLTLRMQCMSISVLEEQNTELRRQLDDLKRENRCLTMSQYKFVTRIETALSDEAIQEL